MVKEIIEEIKELIDFSSDNKIKFNFEEIYSELKHELIVFIDGGNNQIFSSPSFDLSIIRTSAIFFKNGKKEKIIINECYLMNEIRNIKILKKNNDFPWLIPSLKYNERNPEIFRRINEIFLVNELFKRYKNAYIIIDGSLLQQFKENNEEKLVLDLIKKNNVNVVGLVKTNREIKKDKSLYNLINKNSPKNKAWFTEILKKERIYYSYVKLHKNSKYIFKIESINNDINIILKSISKNSCDPIFQGYPYGLILADKFARVTNNEVNIIKTKLIKLLKDDSINSDLNSLNIHKKIDLINN